jgi:hypothetical protein
LSAAQADYTVTTCGGSPAPRWTGGLGSSSAFSASLDQCTTGGAQGFSIASTAMAPNTDVGMGLAFPTGVVLTHVTVHYDTIPTTSGSLAFLRIFYDGNRLLDAEMGNALAGTDLSASVPDGATLVFNVFCSTSASTNCNFSSPQLLTVGAMTLTLHDTGHPSVQAIGGSLAAPGTYSGTQSLAYSASDAGSGVQQVTVSLGATVVGTAPGTCQSFSLQPCPASQSGTIAVNTAAVPDGSYPVILTAYDASGDATPVQVATVTVRNHSATQSLPAPTKPRSVHTKVELTWGWTTASTILKKLTIHEFARSATITITCQGRRCPFKVKRGDGRHVKRFVKALERRVFHSGQKLTITIAQPHLRSERARVTIRRNKKPAARAL